MEQNPPCKGNEYSNNFQPVMGFEGSPFHSQELSTGPLVSVIENGLPLAMKLMWPKTQLSC